MAPALVNIALLALAFGLLWLSWCAHRSWVNSYVYPATALDTRPPRSYCAFWLLTETAGWGVFALALWRIGLA